MYNIIITQSVDGYNYRAGYKNVYVDGERGLMKFKLEQPIEYNEVVKSNPRVIRV